MSQSLRTALTLDRGMLRASATLQDPDVRLTSWDEDMPAISIEEGGVVLELEFPDRRSLARFQRRVAALKPGSGR